MTPIYGLKNGQIKSLKAVIFLHHKLSSPFIILVINIIKSFHYSMETSGQVLSEIMLEERSTKLPVDHRGIVHQKVVPGRMGLNKKILEANLKNIFVSPYPTLVYRYGSVGRNFFSTSQIRYLLNLIVYRKTYLKRPLNKIQKNDCFFKSNYRIMQVKSIAECSQGAFCNTFDLHDAPICLNDLVVYIFEWPF